MTIKLRSIKVDLDRESKGDWVNSLEYPGVKYRVSSLHLPAFKVALSELERKWRRKYKDAATPDEVSVPALGKLLHQHILHDWSGFDEPYSSDLAYEMMSTPQDRNFVTDVRNAAAMISLDQFEFVEDEEKNSAAPSAKK